MSDKPKIMGDVDYRLNGYAHCPICGSDQIEGGPVDIQGAYAVQEVGCIECGAQWDDLYNLTGFINLENGDGAEVDRGHCPYCRTDEDLDLMFEAAANGYANSDQDDTIGRILAGEYVQDRLAEFVVNEIRDIAISHNPEADDYDRVAKFDEVLNAIYNAVNDLERVAASLAGLAQRIGTEESSTE